MSPAPAAPAYGPEAESTASWADSDDLQALLREKTKAVHHFRKPVSLTSLRDLFASLAATWKEDTSFTSSVDEMVLHPAYQQIIGLGNKALPLILSDLRQTSAHWFWALYAITGITPFAPQAYGDVDAMTSAWVDWGKTQGLLI